MFRHRLQRSTAGVAALTAIVLALQTLLMGWAVAAQPMRDAFGNVLCIANHVDDSGPANRRSTPADCCAFGCAWSSDALPQPAAPLPEAHIAPDGLVSDAPLRQIVARQPDHDPASPRAPPHGAA